MGGGKNPLLAKYDTNFDCAEETSFWYIIKDGPFVLEELSQKQRHHIRTAQKRCRVEKIVAAEHADELYEVYHAAYSNYDQPDNERSRENFNGRYLHSTEDCWAAFSTENGAMVGFMFCKNGAPGFFRGRPPQTMHDSISKGVDLCFCQKCCTFAPYSIKV